MTASYTTRSLPLYQKRDVAIHEAAHFVVGAALGMALENPRLVVGDPDRVGRVDICRGEHNPDEFFELPAEIKKTAALEVAAMYLAGIESEMLWNGACDNAPIVYCEGTDLIAATKALELGGIAPNQGLLFSSRLARAVLIPFWRTVMDEADRIRERPPEIVGSL